MLCICFAEVLSDPAVTSKLADTKAAAEVKALEQFYTTLQNDPARAFYGCVSYTALFQCTCISKTVSH